VKRTARDRASLLGAVYAEFVADELGLLVGLDAKTKTIR
jgi:hypothetical protein